jgi:hypothetical protein
MRGRIMVKIRYSELPSGLHVSVTKHGRRTIIYLKPGLTPAERHAALSRVRSSGRMGQGPQHHALSLVAAIGADRIRTTTRNGVTAVRSHPVLLLPLLILLVSTAIVFVLMSFVTLTMAPRQPQAAGTVPGLGGRPSRRLQTPAGTPSSAASGRAGRPGDSPSGNDPHGGHSPASGVAPSSQPSTINAPTPQPSESAGQGPAPSPSAAPGPPSPEPSSLSQSPSPAPSWSSSSGTCVLIWPLGVCITL